MIFKFLLLRPYAHLAHLRKCDSWLLIRSKIFFIIKRQPFLVRLNLRSSPSHIPHLNHNTDIMKGVSNQSQINLFYILPLSKTTVHCVWLQNVIKVMITKMWSWKRSTWTSRLTALLTQKWWLVDWCLDLIFHFSVGAQCQAVELFWKQKSHQMGFDLIVSRGKSGIIRICLKISKH